MQEQTEKVPAKSRDRKLARRPKRRAKIKKRRVRAYPPEFRLRAVLMHLEGGLTQKEVARQVGISPNTFNTWVLAYRREGADSYLFRDAPPPRGGGASRARLPGAVRDQIIELKKQNRSWGVRRIAQVLRRLFLMQASPETVRRTLNQEKLMEPARKKPRRNISKPRRFERAQPNQLWQSDIFTFLLRRHQRLYLTAFMDDHSRFIVGYGLDLNQEFRNLPHIAYFKD